jgi:hypothetical protein
MALAMASALSAAPVWAAQPVYTGPYPVLPTIVFDVDYAVSTAFSGSTLAPGSETIISIGEATDAKMGSAPCVAQVDWFDWDGSPAGLSGPGKDSTGVVNTLTPGKTLEFTSSLNSGFPMEYFPFQENVFRNTSLPAGSKVAFEGHAQIRISCPAGVPRPGLRLDAEVVRFHYNDKGLPRVVYKPVNITKTAGLTGY